MHRFIRSPTIVNAAHKNGNFLFNVQNTNTMKKYKIPSDILRRNYNSYWYNKPDDLFLVFITNNLLYTSYSLPHYWSFRHSLLENKNKVYERLIAL